MTSDAPAERPARRLAELTEDPEAFVAALEDGLVEGEPAEVIRRHLRVTLTEGSSSSALWLASRLERSSAGRARHLALLCLERALSEDPERAWQALRRLARGAEGRREVEELAGVWARGIRAAAFRWAEVEQLVYSERPEERSLVGATLARLASRRAPREEPAGDAELRRVLPLLAMLMGDAHHGVQASLSRALRAWAAVDRLAIEAFLRDQAAIAAEHRDGHRAWVIRDALVALAPGVAAEIRGRLGGIRRASDAPATSIASRQAGAFASGLSRTDAALDVQGERFARSRA